MSNGLQESICFLQRNLTESKIIDTPPDAENNVIGEMDVSWMSSVRLASLINPVERVVAIKLPEAIVLVVMITSFAVAEAALIVSGREIVCVDEKLCVPDIRRIFALSVARLTA